MINIASLRSPVTKGDSPLTAAQFKRKISSSLDRIMSATEREQLLSTQPDVAAQLGQALYGIQKVAESNNVFNHSLENYRNALIRLDKYILSEGRRELKEEVDTGLYDENGLPVLEMVIIHAQIDPLPEKIEAPVFGDDGEISGFEMIKNPLIENDEKERSAAQAVIDNTPQEVKDFYDS